MAFSDFKSVDEALENFKITFTWGDFIESIKSEESTPPAHLLHDFEFAQEHIDVFASESARCHALIYPVLWECYKAYAKDYALWIGKSITYDETLTGTPDYFVSTRSEFGVPVVGTPLILLVEAKRNDFVLGWGQCLAELVAAQKINGDASEPVYGIVSDGEQWQFGRLVGDVFTRNRTRYTSDSLPRLFGAVEAVFRSATGNSSGSI